MTKKKSEMEFINRTRKYLDLKNIHNRKELEIKMSKVFKGGGQPSLKQIDIWTKKLGFEEKKEKYVNVYISDNIRRETYRKGFTRYRDMRTGRFIKYDKRK